MPVHWTEGYFKERVRKNLLRDTEGQGETKAKPWANEPRQMNVIDFFPSRLWKTGMSVLRIQQKNQTCCFACTELRGHMPTKGSFILVSVKENKHRSALFYLLCLLTSVYLKWKGFWLNSWITIERAAFSFNLVYLFEGCSLRFLPSAFQSSLCDSQSSGGNQPCFLSWWTSLHVQHSLDIY